MTTPLNAIVLPNSKGYQKITLFKHNLPKFRLPEMMPSELNSATKFTVDHTENSNVYKTCNVDYSCISSTNVEHVRTAPKVDVVSHWTLSSRNNGTARVNLATILKEDKKFSKAWHESNYGTTGNFPDLSCGQAPVTYEYYIKGLLQKVYDLSAEIYNKYEFHLPSYVGMIVCSGTLTDINAVKKIYGKNTNWKQISFSFMCGQTTTGNTEANSYFKYGHMEPYEFSAREYGLATAEYYSNNSQGEEFTKLTEKNLINHTHLLSAMFQKFNLQWNGYLEMVNEDGNETETFKIWKILREIELKPEEVWVISGTPGGSPYVSDYAKISLEALQWKVTGGEVVSSEDLYGNDIEMSDEIYSESGEKINVADVVYHRNMPPFETKYVWERIS